MFRKILWPGLVAVSILLMVVFLIGGYVALTISQGPSEGNTDGPVLGEQGFEDSSESESPLEVGNHLVILGDSIGFGIGDEETLGIGNRYVALVDPEGSRDIQVTNLAVAGAVVGDLRTLVGQGAYEPDLTKASLIIMSIGGNDLNALQGQDKATLTLDFKEILDAYKVDFEAIVKRIRQVNPDVQVAVVGLYDPYNNKNPEQTKLLLEWNYETRLMVHEDGNMVYIPTYELFQHHLDAYLAFDNFHPSGEGYNLIAQLLYEIGVD